MKSLLARLQQSPLLGPLREVSGASLRPLMWSFVLTVSAQGVLFVSNFLLARLFGQFVFGEWAALQSTINTVSTIAQLSMAITATKYVAQYRVARPDRVGAILALCAATTAVTAVVSAACLLWGSAWLAGTALGTPQLLREVRLSIATICIATVSGYQIGALAGLHRFRALALLTLANGTSSLLLTVLLGIPYGLVGGLLGQAIAQVGSYLSHRWVLAHALKDEGITLVWRRAINEARIFTSFTIPATLSGICGMLGLWGGTVALVHSPVGYSGMADFAAASILRGIVLFPPSVVARVSTSVLSHMNESEDAHVYRRALTNSVLLALGSSGAAAAGVVLFAPQLMGVFGHAFREGYRVAWVLALAGVLESGTNAYCQDFVAAEKMWMNLAIFASRGALIAGGTALLAPRYGALGAALAVVIAHFAGLSLSAWGTRSSVQPLAA